MEQNNIIIDQLQKVGLTKKESQVYYELVRTPYSNGSQIAKILRYPRTSIYSILSKLATKNCILSIPKDDVTTYKAVNPNILIVRLKKELEDASNILEEEFKKMELKPEGNQFLNIESFRGIKRKIVEILSSTKKEVYINTNFNREDLEEFKPIFEMLKKKGVRVVFFYFENNSYRDLVGEHYKRSKLNNDTEGFKRILLVSDMEIAIMASDYGGEFHGTFSQNKLLVNLIAEHIHNDIYIMKLEKNYNGDFWKDIKLDTMQELENRN